MATTGSIRGSSRRPSLVQQGRFVFPDHALAADRCRYVVTLTNQRRDLDALTKLDPVTTSLIVPWIRIVRLAGPNGRVTARRVRDWAAHIGAAAPGAACHVELTEFDPLLVLAAHAGRRTGNSRATTGGPIGGRWATRWTVGQPLFQGLMEELAATGARPIPVLRPAASTERQRNLMATVAYGSAAGAAVAQLLGPRWATGSESVTELLTIVHRLGLDPQHTDLLLEAPPDRGQRLAPDELARTIQRVREGAAWRTVVLVSSGVPSIIPRPDPHHLLTLDRPDWAGLRQLVGPPTAGPAGPVLGDYGPRHPLRLSWAGTKRANIRYTTEDGMVVATGEPTRNGRADVNRYAELAVAIVEHPSFRGAGHCWGCRQIVRCGNEPESGPGSQAAWDTVGLVHHITQLAGQLGAAGPDPAW